MTKHQIHKPLACRFCGALLTHTFVDLGMSPVANDYVAFADKETLETFYPLHVYVCGECFLVQLPEHRHEHEIFTDHYAYFSSYSTSWLDHSRRYVEMMSKRFGFTKKQLVVELASNDGYLLQYFKEKGIPVLGVEPTHNTASVAIEKGIPTITKFFGLDTARELVKSGNMADLLIGNNVLAHVPDLNDFVTGMKFVLKPRGIFTMEFPHLLRLMEKNQFDTIYHEHYSYFSFLTVEQIFAAQNLTLFDVEEIPTHGGSLRIYGRHADNTKIEISPSVRKLREKELKHGLYSLHTYSVFASRVTKIKRQFLEFLLKAKRQGKTIVGYGAPAKGNTFLNYSGAGADFITYTVDASPHKQNHFLPGVRIPIFPPEKIRETKPDYVVILPWNIKDEIVEKMAYIKEWGGKFVTAIPKLAIYS